MSNIIYSRITIEPEKAMDKICDIFDSIEGDTKSLIKTFYDKEDFDKSWMVDNVGSEFIESEIEADILLQTESYHPDLFLKKLYNFCKDEFTYVKIVCNWFNENEIEIGTSVISNDIYTEDEETLEGDYISDPSYSIEGDEDIEDIKEWLNELVEDYDYEIDIEDKDDDEIRDLFSEWRNEYKWDYITNSWNNMKAGCDEAIKTKDFSFPIKIVKSI